MITTPTFSIALSLNIPNLAVSFPKFKDQGDCNSCYAFAAVAVVESTILRAKSIRLDLSEQQVIDCSYKIHNNLNNGCDGGHEIVALAYISENGITTELDYVYVSGKTDRHGTCTGEGKVGEWGKNLGVRQIPKNREDELCRAVATHGPLIVSLSGGNADFKFYKEGIYDNKSCRKQVDHTALLVGYGTEEDRQYWLIKNSFGKDWGDKGYGKLLRGVNQCGIVSHDAYSVYVQAGSSNVAIVRGIMNQSHQNTFR